MLKTGLQFFAESGEAEGEVMTAAEGTGTPAVDGVASATSVEEKKPERTFSRDEVNRIIAAEVQKALSAAEEKKTEAEKLSKMKDDERTQYEKEKAEKDRDAAIAELNAYKLKDEASKIAKEAGLPLEFLELLDFKALDAEQVSKSIETISGVFKSAVTAALNEKLGQKSPSGGAQTHTAGRAATFAQSVSKQFQGTI